MSFILKLVVTSLAVFFGAYILDGVYLSGFPAAILVAVVLGLLNTFLKPLLVLLTIPFTLLTLGLFLLVINAAIILIADAALSGFTVDSFGTAVIFSILVSVFTWLLEAIAGKPSQNRK
jgi:putative membrane protein